MKNITLNLQLYDGVKNDLEGWRQKVKVGGIISGHDYHVHKILGVVPAVNEFIDKYNLQLAFLTNEVNSSF